MAENNELGLYDFSSMRGAQQRQPNSNVGQPPALITRLQPAPQDPRIPFVMDQASQENPAEFARVKRLSEQSGIPMEAVRGNPAEVEGMIKAEQYDFGNMSQRSPVTGTFISDYNNAVLAQNDVPVLERIEKLAKTLQQYSTGMLLAKGTGIAYVANENKVDVARSLPAGAMQDIGMRLSGGGRLIDAGGRTLARAADFILPETADQFIWANPADEYLQKLDPAAWLRATGNAVQQAGEAVGVDEEDQNIATQVSSGLGQMVSQVLTHVFAKPLSAPSLFAVGVEQQGQRQDATGTEGSSQAADNALILGGITTLVTERAGIDALLERVPPMIKDNAARALSDVFIAGGVEAVQEVAENVSQALIEQYSTNPQAPLLEGLPEQAAVGFGVGAIMRALILTAVPGKLGVATSDQQAKIEAGTTEQESLDQLNQMISETELRQISPETLADFMQRVDGDNDTQVYIDGAQLSLYLQENRGAIRNDPALALLADQAAEAGSLGTSVGIPIQQFASIIAGTPHYEALRDAMTINPGSTPVFRQDQSNEEFQNYMSGLVQQAQQNVSQYVEAQEIYDNVRQQLVDTGVVSERNAGVMAQIVPAWATVYARKTGQTVAEVYAKSGLKIIGPQTGEMDRLTAERDLLTQANNIVSPESEITDVTETVLGMTYTSPNGATISVMEDSPYSPRPNSITEFVVPKELRGQGVGRQLLSQILERYNPMTVSAAASSESSTALFYRAGFRPIAEPDATLDRSLELMREWTSVTMVIPETAERDLLTQANESGYEGQDIAGAREWVAGVEKFGAEGMTTEARMARAREMGFDTDTVLYHGTASDIGEFNRGTNARGRAGAGVYFARNAKVPNIAAEHRARTGGGAANVMPVYVRSNNPYVTDTHADDLLLGLDTEVLENEGYTGVDIFDLDGNLIERTVFDPSNIRSVNAAFDPDFTESADLLAQRGPSARGYYDPANTVIRLTEAADLSTFLHEFGHFMMEMEKNLDSDTWRSIGKWFKRNANLVAAEANGYVAETGDLSQEVLPPGVTSPNAEVFREQLLAARDANPNGASVWVGTADDYKDMRRFTLDNGRVGFAIELDGNLTGVFKHPESTMQGAMNTIMPLAIQAGATKLDAFEGPLTEMYSKHGFREVGRVKFNPNMMPENWNINTMGTPDVVFMELTDEAAAEAKAKRLPYTNGVRASSGVLAQSSRTPEEYTREEDGSLRGLPRNVGKFTPTHNRAISDVAEKYMRDRGLEYNPPNVYAGVDPERAARIAAAYDAMEHDPQNPEVMAAYDAMIEETIAQYEAALEAGLRVEFIDFAKQGDPYAESPRLAIEDITKNNHMWVFSTRDGFGSDDTFDPSDNPLLRETEFEISGQKALVNDLFRVVHDYFGHAKEGVGFRAGGEENAWRAHSAMYSPLARKAMTSETRGQNSWVNYGPYGEQNRSASAAETHYADQKIGLLPDWVVTEGAGDTDVLLQREDVPGEFEGPITEEDVQRYVDDGTTGDETKDRALYRATHEQFARGWEKYLMEGKAPSIELRNIFRTFARWLTQIYQKIKGGLRVTLDPEIRAVFDRMIASEEQISAAEARARVEPMFTDAAMAGMTEEQFAEYQKNQQNQKDKAVETLRDKLIKELTRTTEAWWNQEKSDLADEAAEALADEPVYRSANALRNGEMKLDRVAVRELVGETVTDSRGRTYTRVPAKLNGMTVTGGDGVTPDDAAAFLGYNSGSEMLTDIINSPTLREAAEARAQEQMVEKYGDILNDGTIEQEADDALQNEERGELLLSELKSLSRSPSIARLDRQNIKAMAEENIAKLSYRQIQPGKYRSAEIRAAQEAAVALERGDRDAAAQAKMRQVMNFYLGRAATDARTEIDKITTFMARYNTKTVQTAIAKAENGYWEQLVKILTRFEFRKSATMKQVDRVNQDINTWAAERISEHGDGLVISDAVMDESYVTHWKNVPYADLQGVHDTVRNIEHVARYGNKIRLMAEEVEFKKLVSEWTGSIRSKVKGVWKAQRTTAVEEGGVTSWAMAQMTKIPFMASWLDGGERVGLSHEILVQPFNDALNEEYNLYTQVAEPVMNAIRDRSREDKKRHMRKVYIPEIRDAENDGNLMGHQIVAVALNVGNQSNLRKMLLGEGWATKDDESTISLDNPKLQAVLRHMTKSDWDLVQKIWDQMDKLYPQLAEVHRKSTGLTPKKVQSTPVQTPFGEYRGGYYPVKYDPNRSTQAELNEQKLQASTDSMFSTMGGIQQSVNASATSERTGYYGPIYLSLEVVPNHFQEVIHYITHHEAVRQVNKLIRNPEVGKAIKEALGPDEFKQLRPWLNDIAKDGRDMPSKTFVDAAFGKLRFGLTLGYMGFKASTGIIQVSGLSNAAAEVGGVAMTQALRTVLGSPSTIRSAWQFASENSKVLSHRMKTMDREMRSALESLQGKRGFMKAVQEASMKHIAFIQTYMVDLPSWYAGYIKELGRSGDEQKAFQYGDWVVEQVQGSGATKDMAAIMRNQTKTHRIFTMFMTFFSSLWNMERDLARGVRGKQYSYTTTAAKLMFMFTIPVLFDMWLRGDLLPPDDEDEDDRIQRMMGTTAMYAIGGVPFVRDVANATVGEFGYSMTPVAQVLESGINAIPELATRPFTDEEITKGQAKGATQLTGAFLGVPGVSQAWATGESLYKVLEEGEEITARELLFGPRRE